MEQLTELHNFVEESTLVNIEKERMEKMKDIKKRRENLEIDRRNTYLSLISIQNSEKNAEKIKEFNELIEKLNEMKNDVLEKFRDVVICLKSLHDQLSNLKLYFTAMKSSIGKLENHLTIIEKTGSSLASFDGLVNVGESISLTNEWVDFFVERMKYGSKRAELEIQLNCLCENLAFIEEHDSEAVEVKHFQVMVQSIKKQIDQMKIFKWEQKHVDSLKQAIQWISDDIDEIKIIRYNFSTCIIRTLIKDTNALQLY